MTLENFAELDRNVHGGRYVQRYWDERTNEVPPGHYINKDQLAMDFGEDAEKIGDLLRECIRLKKEDELIPENIADRFENLVGVSPNQFINEARHIEVHS